MATLTLERPADGSSREAVIEYADSLYHREEFKEVFEYLREVLDSGNDPELAWRTLRSGFRLGQQRLDSGNSAEAERIAETAMGIGKRALKDEDRNFLLHKWAGVMYRLLGDIKGIKVKIENSYAVREHFMKAIEIRPEDGFVKHLMGRWCYRIASVTWLQRKMASAILGTPPTSSYDEAFSYFNSAEEAKPGFFKANWLWLGKTLLQQKKKSEAKKWLQRLADAETEGIDDGEAKVEAIALLKGL